MIFLYLLRASAALTSLMALKLHSYDHVEVFYKFLRVPTSLLLLFNVQTFLRYLYGFNHFLMVLNRLINGLGWIFPDISNLEIILCETLLHQYI